MGEGTREDSLGLAPKKQLEKQRKEEGRPLGVGVGVRRLVSLRRRSWTTGAEAEGGHRGSGESTVAVALPTGSPGRLDLKGGRGDTVGVTERRYGMLIGQYNYDTGVFVW